MFNNTVSTRGNSRCLCLFCKYLTLHVFRATYNSYILVLISKIYHRISVAGCGLVRKKKQGLKFKAGKESVFGDFNVHLKDWLAYSGGIDRLCESAISQTNLLRWLTFLLRSQAVILTVLLFWI